MSSIRKIVLKIINPDYNGKIQFLCLATTLHALICVVLYFDLFENKLYPHFFTAFNGLWFCIQVIWMLPYCKTNLNENRK